MPAVDAADYASFQEAIDAAGNGGSVSVASGLYTAASSPAVIEGISVTITGLAADTPIPAVKVSNGELYLDSVRVIGEMFTPGDVSTAHLQATSSRLVLTDSLLDITADFGLFSVDSNVDLLSVTVRNGASLSAIAYYSYGTPIELTINDSSFTTTEQALYLYASVLDRLTATITNSTFNDNVGQASADIYAENVQLLDISNTSFTGASATDGASIYAAYSSVSCTTCGFMDSSATNGGGALYLNNSELDCTGCDFQGTSAVNGGAIKAVASSVYIDGGSVDEVTSSASGAIYLYQSSFSAQNVYFGNNYANEGAALWSYDGTYQTISLTGCTFARTVSAGVEELRTTGSTLSLHNVAVSGASGTEGGVIKASSSTVWVSDSLFWDNQASVRGGVFNLDHGGLALIRNRFFHNKAPVGAIVYDSSTALRSQNNVYVGNLGADMFYGTDDYADHRFQNNTFIANDDLMGGYIGRLSFSNNLVMDNLVGIGLDARPNMLLGGNNLWYNNNIDQDGALGSAYTGQRDLHEDPLIWSGFSTADPGSLPYLSARSPAIDAGDRRVSDPDGSVSDIGALGGGGAHAWWPIPDFDGDGFDLYEDCDDDDASVYPGATDLWEDGVDQDCDGDDQHGPSTGGDTGGGLPPRSDCHPTLEVLDDGRDQDCDGVDARARWGSGGGCVSAPAPIGLWALFSGVALAWRRRSS